MRKIILLVAMMLFIGIAFGKTIKLDDKTCNKVVIYSDSVKQVSGEYIKIYYAVWDNFVYESDEKTYNYYLTCKELNIHPKYVVIDNNWVVKQ